MAPDKSLAAEIEAVPVETLAEAIRRQVVLLRFNEASTLDQFFDADEIDLLCIRAANAVKDHVAAEIAALQSRAFEDGAQTPSEPSPGLLMSMAMRYDHSLGMPGCRDWKMMPGLGEREPGRHARILANTMGKMRQLWEEVTGNGFYCPAREADYVASAKSCGVTFNEIGRPMALPLQPKGERNA